MTTDGQLFQIKRHCYAYLSTNYDKLKILLLLEVCQTSITYDSSCLRFVFHYINMC